MFLQHIILKTCSLCLPLSLSSTDENFLSFLDLSAFHGKSHCYSRDHGWPSSKSYFKVLLTTYSASAVTDPGEVGTSSSVFEEKRRESREMERDIWWWGIPNKSSNQAASLALYCGHFLLSKTRSQSQSLHPQPVTGCEPLSGWECGFRLDCSL